MKFYTDALISKKPKLTLKSFFLGQSGQQNQYYANHVDSGMTLMWIEATQFGKRHAFPCVLEEADGPMVFRTVSTPRTAMQNAELIKRWTLLVNEELLQQPGWTLRDMPRREFYQLFNKYERELVEQESAEAEREAAERDEEPVEKKRPLLFARRKKSADSDTDSSDSSDC